MSHWVMWFAGIVGGWALRGLWINRKVKRLLREAEFEMEHGDLEGAKAKLDRSEHIISVL